MTDLLLSNALVKLGISALREKQHAILDILKSGEDLMVVLPTGYGKSLAFQIGPFCYHNQTTTGPWRALIVMPLTVLMLQQTEKLGKCGFKASHVNNYKQVRKVFHDASTTHVFLSPETLLTHGVAVLNEMALEDKERFSYIFVDESHCVVQWGHGHKKTEAFRYQYGNIGSVRAHLPSAVMIAMTATAPIATQQSIMGSLQMSDTTEKVLMSPQKTNIRYAVLNVSGNIVSQFQWLIDYLNRHLEHSERFLIFCKQLKHIGLIYNALINRCPPNTVQMYHSKTSEPTQHKIASDICDGTSQLRVVICSSSFSMGFDIPKLHYVLHYGMPSTLDDYIQETGRCGRDKEQSFAVVINHKHSLVGSSISSEAKEYVRTENCRRHMLMKLFLDKISDIEKPVGYLCCDNCSVTYSCCSCDSAVPCDHTEQSCYCTRWCALLPLLAMRTSSKPTIVSRQAMTTETLQLCREKMTALSDIESVVVPKQLTSQIYTELLDNIFKHYREISTEQDVMQLGAYSVEIARILLRILDYYAPRLAASSVIHLTTGSTSSTESECSSSKDVDYHE